MKKFLAGLTAVMCMTLSAAAGAAEAINFKFTDRTGKPLQLSDYKGKWVLVNFWAPWCPRCITEFPDLNTLDAREDFAVVSIALDYGTDEAAVHNLVNRHKLNFPIVIGGSRRDPDSAARQIGPVDFYPTSYLYSPNGEMVMFIPGRFSPPKLLAYMDSHKAQGIPQTMLAGKPLTKPADPATAMAAETPVLPAPVVAPADFQPPAKARASKKIKS
jgi:thiol-disulfide isomerase/thioredoxin